MVDTPALGAGIQRMCGFKSHSRYKNKPRCRNGSVVVLHTIGTGSSPVWGTDILEYRSIG